MSKVKLIPAVIYKQQIIEESQKLYYTDSELYYVGWVGNTPVNILDNDESGSVYQYAICNMNDKLIGYIAYRLDLYTSQAYNFGIMSFDRGNVLIGYAVKEVMDKLINKNKVHRIEFRCVGGNPAKRAYDRFCKKYNGRCIELRDTIKDEYGIYHNEYIYEIVLEDKKCREKKLMEENERLKKALEQEPCEDWYDVPSEEMTLEQARQAVKDLREKLAEYLEQQPCTDAISREMALDCDMNVRLNKSVINQYPVGEYDYLNLRRACFHGIELAKHEMESYLIDLPSVTPQPKEIT